MRQKFKRLSFVRVRIYDRVPIPSTGKGNQFISWETLSTFEEFDGIIEGSYSQLFGGENVGQYAVYVIGKDGAVNDRRAWFDDEQVILLPDQDGEKAEQMIEDYNCGKSTKK